MLEINLIQNIKAPAESIFPYLTKQELLAKWLTPAVIAFPKKGTFAAFALGNDINFKVEIIEFIENKELRWKCIDGNVSWLGSEISFEIRTSMEGLPQLEFRQTGLKNEEEAEKWKNNWQFYLSALNEMAS